MLDPTLKKWVTEQTISDTMRWKTSWGDQIQFFRDNIVNLFCAGIDYEEREGCCTVISTHRSKSIVLPVYKLHRPDIGLTLIFRNNFYNWKMSVISASEINVDFTGLFYTVPPMDPSYTGDQLASCCFEGFPHELIYGYFEPSDKKKFSAEISGNHTLWTVMFLMMRSFGAIKPCTWHTRESHRADEATRAQ